MSQQIIVLVYSYGRKFEGSQGFTFEGVKKAIQINRDISYDSLKDTISAKLKLQSDHQIISNLTYRFPNSESTYTDLEIWDDDDVECMIGVAEKHSDVKVLEVYAEIDVVVDSSITTNSDHPNSDSPDEGMFDANNDVVDGPPSSSVVPASPFASSLHIEEIPQQTAGKDYSSSPPSTSIPPPPPPPSRRYHVFLSFRGEDTRKGFSDHLKASLERKGLITFRDDINLGRGETITSELLKAIEDSMFAIIIFSPNYAASTWCLEELVTIVGLKYSRGLFVMPVFYDVDPSDVRYQKGSFEEAFAKHEQRFRHYPEKVQRWRRALAEIASYSGWSSRNEHEAKLVENIAERIHDQVMANLSFYNEKLGEIASRVEEVIRLMDSGLKDVRSAYMRNVFYRE